ncbi:MAG: 50S ribosomal protein L13 [Verrucomicrobia bacterium]|nr:50S ribosomal protein L13 [Verrucomicrobiota bacterium]
MKTFLPKDSGADRAWYIVDAADRPLGRLAARVASVLRGKNKVTFSPQVDNGDFVVVINAGKVKLTGKKMDQKIYDFYSGFRGGLKEIRASAMRERHPDRMIKLAVHGMLPKNTMSRKLIARLRVYADDKHPHAAQKPQVVEVA